MNKLFEPVREAVEQSLPEGMPFIAVMDDTMARKRGRKVKGAGWRRDPLGPPFHTNFVWSQRFLQTAAILPEAGLSSRARAIPIEMRHCPTPKRPGKEATAQDWAQYRLDEQAMRITAQGLDSIRKLRAQLDAQPKGRDRQLVVAVDGGYTNGTLFRNIPERTGLIGRVRKDAKLYSPPQSSANGRGRRRIYGDLMPTPEQIRQDDSIPWQTVEAYAGGKVHSFDVKIVGPVRWKGAGGRDMTLVVIRPLAYRPKKGSKLLYRQPAYLVCTDPTLPIEIILQAYLWRWEVEVTFREEKTILGLGEAQVRTEPTVANVPTFIAAIYAYLHLAAASAGLRPPVLPKPKWQTPKPNDRCTTTNLIGLMRTELWGRALRVNFGGFATRLDCDLKPPKILNNAASAVIYAQR